MRITLVNSGTRGDAQPLAVLAVELTRRGHDVTLGLPPNLVDLGLRCGIRTAPFGPDTLAFMESPEGVRWLAAGDLSTFMRELGQVAKAHIAQTMREMRDLAEGAELVVGGLLAEDLALPSAEALGVPYASFHSAPYRRTRDFPQPMVTTRSLPRPLNRATGALFDRVWWKEVRDNVAAYRTQLGLPSDPTPTATRLDRSGALEIQGYSASLVPAPRDYGPHRPLTGPPTPDAELRRELGDGAVDQQLERWLAAGSTPVYVGMGSMPIQSPEQTLATVTDVVRRLGVRAVVSSGWSRLVPPSAESGSRRRLRRRSRRPRRPAPSLPRCRSPRRRRHHARQPLRRAPDHDLLGLRRPAVLGRPRRATGRRRPRSPSRSWTRPGCARASSACSPPPPSSGQRSWGHACARNSPPPRSPRTCWSGLGDPASRQDGPALNS